MGRYEPSPPTKELHGPPKVSVLCHMSLSVPSKFLITLCRRSTWSNVLTLVKSFINYLCITFTFVKKLHILSKKVVISVLLSIYLGACSHIQSKLCRFRLGKKQFLKWANPGQRIIFIFDIFKHKFYIKNCWL